jgi:hypothetical protein
MSRCVSSLAVILVLSACGGGPTSPDGGSSIQSLLNSATPEIKVSGVTVQPGSTTNIAIGATVDYRVNYSNNSGQTLHTALVIVRDDGAERVITCGATGSGGSGGAFGVSGTVFANDGVYTPGHTVRVLLLGALGSGPTGPGQCLLQSTQGQANRAAVQAERLLITFAVQ